ncbi:hypothetical protein NMY22_g9526 [Coprinellus aureogranulatus]|nr:hypothetical protein NMY22_g9526 [Coprinellus aureogranulatus]
MVSGDSCDATMKEVGKGRRVSVPAFPLSQAKKKHFESHSTASLPLMGLVKSQNTANIMEEDDGWSALPPPVRPWDSSSALVSAQPRSPSSSPKSRRPLSSIFTSNHNPPLSPKPTAQVPAQSSGTPPRPAVDAVVTNFLFDTSLGHNTISRDTLYALGFSTQHVEGLESSEISTAMSSTGWLGSEMTEAPSSSHYVHGENYGLFGGSNEPKTVSLYLQNASKPITFRLAPAGEPSRLGVQFLLESEVNVCTSDNGAAAILWLDRAEKRMANQYIPKTVPLPKSSLQARVRAFLGLRAL